MWYGFPEDAAMLPFISKTYFLLIKQKEKFDIFTENLRRTLENIFLDPWVFRP